MVRLRALLRSNEFYLIPLALVIGTLAGAIVTLMAEIAQIAHMVIYGIPDRRAARPPMPASIPGRR